ncbi:MAG: C25 family peptidase C-terminal domain-containing protein, partial [Flavobacteriales bacterium]|nr:C25 family peptidase C-terminal domain-containing protein [Flavobacteriales bacterium]
MPYIGVPTLLSVSHQSAIPVATSTLTVTTEENAYVAISMNGVLLDAQLADVTGIVNLTFPAISNVGVADIVVTKQFKQPYMGTVQIISPTGPYVIYSSSTINDPTGNNNSLADYNELIDMTVDLHNVGSFNANNVSVVISTTDPYVTLTNTTANVPLINASQTITIPTPFSFQVASPVPDQHTVVFNLTMTDNSGNSWSSTVNVVLNAPVLEHTTFTIDDAALGNGDGRIDAGETFDLIVDVINTGHADVVNLIATLAISLPYITVNTVNNNVPSLLVNGQYSTIFNVTTSAVVPFGTYANFNFEITDGAYSYNTNFIELIGDLAEDYETGDFTQFAWIIDADYPWIVDNTQIYEGLNSSRSYSGLPDGEESELSITVDVAAVGDISFWKFLSSEQNEDELKFKINGTKVGEWSGEDVAWSYVS